MALAFHCPHCGQALPVSAAQLGQKVQCQSCQANFFLAPTHLQAPGGKAPPPAASSTVITATAVATAPAPATAAPAVAPQARPLTATTLPAPVATPALRAASGPQTAPPAAQQAVPAARPQTATPAKPAGPPPTVLKAAPDGKLPTLSLEADVAMANKNASQQGPSTVVVFATLAISVTLTLAVLLLDFESEAAPTNSAEVTRRDIQRFYGDEHAQLLPYQKLLREAQRAHTRGDLTKERKCYRQVLELLRAEGRSVRKTLTGSSGDDQELERMMNVLLRDVQDTSLF